MDNIKRVFSALLVFVLCPLLGVGCRRPQAWQLPAPPSIQSPKKEFTLIWDQQDPNGGPLNPYWGLEKTENQIPPRAETPQPDPCAVSPFSKSCSENQGIVLDRPQFPNSLICAIGDIGAPLDGHADWTVATQQGCIDWEYQAVDGDYNFSLFPPNAQRSGLTRNNLQFIGTEYDGNETTVNSRLPYWTDLRTKVEEENNGQQSLEPEILALLNRGDPTAYPRAAQVGLFGLDCEHGCKSEVHPVLAFAIESKADPNDDTWDIFIRNWGSGGYCSRYRHLVDFPNNQLSILLLDDPDSDGIQVIPGKTTMYATPGSGIGVPTLSYMQNHGPVLTFSMPAPESAAYAELEIHFRWNKFKPPSCAKAAPQLAERPAISAPNEAFTAEQYLGSTERAAPAAKPAQLKAFRSTAVRKSRFTAPLTEVTPPTEKQEIKTFTPLPPSARTKVRAVPLLVDRQKAEEDAAYIQGLCNVYGNRLPQYRGQDISARLCNQKQLDKQVKKYHR